MTSAPDNTTHPQSPPSETLSPQALERARLGSFVAAARAEKDALRSQIKDLLLQATETQSQIDKVTVAIANCEYKIQMLNGSRFRPVSPRDRAIAAGLMGQDVDIGDLPSESFEKQLTADDLASGLRALKIELEHHHSRMKMAKHKASLLQDEYIKQHAIEHAAEFLLAREEIVKHFLSLCAAQHMAREKSPFAFLTPPHFEERFSIPSPDAADALVVMRKNKIVGREDTEGLNLATSQILNKYRHELRLEMEA